MPGLKLMAELGLDGSGFASGFRQAKGFAEGAGEGLKHFIIGAVGVGTVEEAIRRTADTAKELVESSERLAIAPEQLQVMRQAAKNSNVEFEKLVETMEKLSVAREKALIPGKEGQDARRAFGAAGIGGDQLRSMTSSQMLLGPLRDAVNKSNPEQLGIIFRELGIKAFGGLIPLLKTNFGELEDKMKSMGAIMDTETAVKLKMLSDQFSLLGQIIVSQLGPAIIKFAEAAYTASLKIGSGAAKTGTFMGAMVGAQGPGGFATSIISAIGHSIAHGVGFISDNEFDRKMRQLIPKAAVEGIKSGDDFFVQKQKEFEAFLDEMARRAKDLQNPTPPDLSHPTLGPKLGKKELENPTDSLVRVGNFLGGSQLQINRLAEKRTEYLRQIAANTKIERSLAPTSAFAALTKFPHG